MLQKPNYSIIEYIKELDSDAGDVEVTISNGDYANVWIGDTALVCYGNTITPSILLDGIGNSTQNLPSCLSPGYLLHSYPVVPNPVYNSGPNTTDIEIVGLEPGTTGITGKWYLSEKVLLNGEDVRANALTHTLSYDPAAPGASGEGSVLFSVGIKGVLS